MSFNFFTSGWHLLLSFFGSVIGIFAADITYFSNWLGNTISFFFVSWGSSFSSYGPLIPLLMVVSVSLSIAGAFAAFMLFDGVNAVVGGN